MIDVRRPLVLRRAAGSRANGTLTTTGLIVAIILMAILTAVNFLGRQDAGRHQQRDDLVEDRRPAADHPGAGAVQLPRLATSPPPTASTPTAVHGILLAVATSGIIFSYLGFEQADQLAGEAKNPKKDIPFAIIGSILIGMFIYILLQIAFLVALPADAIGKTWDETGNGLYTTFTGPFAEVATAAQPRLAGLRSSTSTRSSPRPAPA